MSTATLAGHTATHARVTLPAWGVWWATAELAEEVELEAGAEVALVLADLTLQGAIMSGGPTTKGQRSRYCVAGGRGGWGRTVPRKSYANDLGVKAATVLKDAAAAAGETLVASSLPSSTVGPSFVRLEAPASRVLEQLVPQGWHVGEDGVTRVGRRARAEYSGQATLGELDQVRQTRELSSDEIATLLPGIVVEGLEAVDVVHELTPKKIRSTLWGLSAVAGTRELEVLKKLIGQLMPDYRYRGTYEFRVVSQEGERLNLQAVRASLGLPDLRRVRVRPGLPGCRADVALGSMVLVTFVNADPSRPIVVGFEDAESGGFAPTTLELLADGPTLGVARITDPVVAGPFGGTITGGSTRLKAGL